jgi:hypothetical protein
VRTWTSGTSATGLVVEARLFGRPDGSAMVAIAISGARSTN